MKKIKPALSDPQILIDWSFSLRLPLDIHRLSLMSVGLKPTDTKN